MFARLMGLKTISPDQLQRRVQEPEPITVFDVNARGSWMSAHVPGARHLDPAGYTDSDLPSDRNAALVFYCSNPMCMKAPNAARRAKKMGYGNVQVMSAGISGWIAAKLPTEAGG
jgi:rhodanese-related sulfurtransferase